MLIHEGAEARKSTASSPRFPQPHWVQIIATAPGGFFVASEPQPFALWTHHCWESNDPWETALSVMVEDDCRMIRSADGLTLYVYPALTAAKFRGRA